MLEILKILMIFGGVDVLMSGFGKSERLMLKRQVVKLIKPF
jgi:hypothetical protein